MSLCFYLSVRPQAREPPCWVRSAPSPSEQCHAEDEHSHSQARRADEREADGAAGFLRGRLYDREEESGRDEDWRREEEPSYERLGGLRQRGPVDIENSDQGQDHQNPRVRVSRAEERLANWVVHVAGDAPGDHPKEKSSSDLHRRNEHKDQARNEARRVRYAKHGGLLSCLS